MEVNLDVLPDPKSYSPQEAVSTISWVSFQNLPYMYMLYTHTYTSENTLMNIEAYCSYYPMLCILFNILTDLYI